MKRSQKIWILIAVGLSVVIFIISNQTSSKPSKSFELGPSVSIDLPYSFRTKEAEQLSVKAFDLGKAGQFDEAIRLYQKAIVIEHDNPKLFFDMSECYARINRLNKAILAIDTAITLDSLYAPFYSNRGFYCYKLYRDQDAIDNYKKAISLDSMNHVYHGNLAAVYYVNSNIPEACAEFRLAVRLGTNLDDLRGQPELEKLKDICR